jgi:DNA replication protein DnaC
MNNFTYERLHDNLQYLKLDTIEAILDNYLELAAKDGKATMEVLDYLLEQERKHIVTLVYNATFIYLAL